MAMGQTRADLDTCRRRCGLAIEIDDSMTDLRVVEAVADPGWLGEGMECLAEADLRDGVQRVAEHKPLRVHDGAAQGVAL